MAGFGIGINSQGSDAGEVRGSQKEIGCYCWFTSNGKLTPILIKIKDENGEIHSIRDIKVHSQEKKNYAGTPSIEFDCTISFLWHEYRVWLIYYQSENRWVLNFR